MKQLLAAACATVISAGAAFASTVDFTDGTFGVATPVGTDFQTITETADGVTFTLTATNNLVGGARWLGSGTGMSSGLQLGGGSGSTLAFTLSVDMDVELDGYASTRQTLALGAPTFDILDGASPLSEGNELAPAGSSFTFASDPVMLMAGTDYTVTVNNTGAAVQAGLASIDFTKVTMSPVPLPAGLPLLLAALGGFALIRRRAR